jgi:hypothetical protein
MTHVHRNVHQAGKWQFAELKLNDDLEEYYDSKQKADIDLNADKLYPVLIVVESKCRTLIVKEVQKLLMYAEGAKQYRVEKAPESTSDSDNQMDKETYEERIGRLTTAVSSGTQPKSQTAAFVPTKVSFKSRTLKMYVSQRRVEQHKF